jgi:hypothetical protein
MLILFIFMMITGDSISARVWCAAGVIGISAYAYFRFREEKDTNVKADTDNQK